MSLIDENELDELLNRPPTPIPKVVFTDVKVRLSCNHETTVRAPVDVDLDALFTSSICPEGCGDRLIIEEVQEEKTK